MGSAMTERDDALAAGELETDRVTVRQLSAADLDAVIRIDRQATGRSRDGYYKTKLREALEPGTLHASLAAVQDDHVVGFVIARLYYGEFGRSEPVALIDSVAVDPGYRRHKVGKALMRQLLMNLAALNVERVETLVDWNHFDLIAFMASHGFEPAPRLCLRRTL
jgi:predicted N-acetyltransferase YhbS